MNNYPPYGNAAQSNGGLGAVYPAPPIPPPATTAHDTILQAAVAATRTQASELVNLLGRMDSMKSRCLGPEPACGESAPKPPICGVFSELSESSQRIDMLIAALHRSMTDLERIA